MRKLTIQLVLFAALFEGLGRIDILALASALAGGIALIVCLDLLLDSRPPR